MSEENSILKETDTSIPTMNEINNNDISVPNEVNKPKEEEEEEEPKEDLFSKVLEVSTTGNNADEKPKLPHIADDDINVDDISDSDSDSSNSSDDNDEEDAEAEEEDADDVDADDEVEEGDDNDAGPIRSKNELIEEPVIEIPEDYKVKPNEKIQPLGTIKSIYENNIIVAATISGEQRVLKDGSIFCLENREVIGTLSEVFGPLSNPFYRICFKKEKQEQIEKLVKENMGSTVYYVVPEAHWVDTFELKRMKGTDASNGFDEELAESEQEFSDDEKEALFKKMKKDGKNKSKNKNKNNSEGSKRINNTTSSNHNIQKQRNKGNHTNPKSYNTNRNNNNNNNRYGEYPTMRLPAGMTTTSTGPVTHGYMSRTARQNTGREQSQKPRQDSSIYDDEEYSAPKPKTKVHDFALGQPKQSSYSSSTVPPQENGYYNSNNQPHSNINYQQQSTNMNYQQPNMIMNYQQPMPNMNMNNNQYNTYGMQQVQQMQPQMTSTYNNQYYGNLPTQQQHRPQVHGNNQYIPQPPQPPQPQQPPQQNMDQVMQLHQLLMKQAQNSQGQNTQQFPAPQDPNYRDQTPY